MKVYLDYTQLLGDVPGGIGTYIHGLKIGFDKLSRKEKLVCLNELKLPARCLKKALFLATQSNLVYAPRDADVVHACSFAYRRPRSSQELCAMIHDLIFLDFPELFTKHGVKWHLKALEKTIKRAHHLITFSKELKERLTQLGTLNVSVLQPGADHLEEPNYAKAKKLLESLGVSNRFVLTVSTLEPRKNVKTIIKGFTQIKHELPGHPSLLICGPKGWGGETYPNAKDVHLLGKVPNDVLSALYEIAYLFIYIPLIEGYGLPPIEAMSKKCPVIASPVPSVRGDLCVIINPEDADTLASKILYMFENERARNEIALKGYNYAKDLTWETCAKGHLEIWRNLC